MKSLQKKQPLHIISHVELKFELVLLKVNFYTKIFLGQNPLGFAFKAGILNVLATLALKEKLEFASKKTLNLSL